MTDQRNDEFPDTLFLNHVRDALWRRPSQASVMIGSGFSRNARTNRPDAPDIPLWDDLARALAKSLTRDNQKGEHTRHEPAADRVLDLAQKYKDSFGRTRLHQFLMESVRDEDFSPGKLHQRLLELPWSDVFTTNWDTLLEQCLPVPERAYTLVTSKNHLPVCPSPRIVKLHGSIPGTFPLIATKKDYRRYRKRYASFVNTVQQAMMETVFLLLGFSGEDPNFRQWLKWVRKNLGASAPRIYLAGWLRLSKSRRKELREKNVVPIDLARHPQAENWSEPLRHAKAMEWVLLSLEHGRPYAAEDWPSHVAPGRPCVPAELSPVQSVSIRRPMEESWDQAPGKPHEPAYLEKIRDALHIWRHNRECYPSWLVMPFGAALDIRANSDHWQPLILAALPHLAGGPERLGALSELVWRREAALDPLFKDLQKAVGGVLEEIDCERRLVGGEEPGDQDWGRVRRQWRTLAAALVTEAR
ncbi:MAG: SIR2 family protein, partial [Candidatus Aminicenantes bacterium]|nr:SIR2 family protein [Candidatus Aminicenantes bacterium]